MHFGEKIGAAEDSFSTEQVPVLFKQHPLDKNIFLTVGTNKVILVWNVRHRQRPIHKLWVSISSPFEAGSASVSYSDIFI